MDRALVNVLDMTRRLKEHSARLVKKSYSYNKLFTMISFLSLLWLFHILTGKLQSGTLHSTIFTSSSFTSTATGNTTLGSAVAVAGAVAGAKVSKVESRYVVAACCI